ncbi:MAG: AI-2E family transporter [Anaerolineales bacterium]
MTFADFIKRTIAFIVLTLGSVGAIIIIWTVRDFLLLVLTGWVLAVALDVPIGHLQRLRIPRNLSIALVFSGLALLVLLVVVLALPPILTETIKLLESLPGIIETLVADYATFYEDSGDIQAYLPEITLEDYYRTFEPEALPDSELGDMPEDPIFSPQNLVDQAVPVITRATNLLGAILADAALVLFIALYFLLDPLPYYEGIVMLVPRRLEQRAVEIINDVREIIVNWLSALVVASSTSWLLTFFALGLLLNIPNAAILGLVAAFSKIVPNLGYYLSIVPIMIVTLADDPAKLPAALFLYTLFNEIESKAITPYFVKSTLHLPAGLVLAFQLLAGLYLGFLGVLLAIPILSIVILLIRELYILDTLKKPRRSFQIQKQVTGGLVYISQPERDD